MVLTYPQHLKYVIREERIVQETSSAYEESVVGKTPSPRSNLVQKHSHNPAQPKRGLDFFRDLISFGILFHDKKKKVVGFERCLPKEKKNDSRIPLKLAAVV